MPSPTLAQVSIKNSISCNQLLPLLEQWGVEAKKRKGLILFWFRQDLERDDTWIKRHSFQREILLRRMSHSFKMLFLFALLLPPWMALIKSCFFHPFFLASNEDNHLFSKSSISWFHCHRAQHLWKIKCYNSLRIKPTGRTVNSFLFFLPWTSWEFKREE